MKGKIKDRGVVVKISPYSESSLIIRCQTRERGLIPILAKGLRKQTPKDLPVVLNEYELTLYEPNETGLFLYNESSLIKEHAFGFSPEVWTAAQCGVELISAQIIHGNEHETIYDFLLLYLDYLAGLKGNSILVFWRFFIRLMQILGVPFSSAKCGICHAEGIRAVARDKVNAELLCAECYYACKDNERYTLLSSQSAGILDLLPSIGKHIDNLHLERSTVREINALLLDHYQAHFNKTLKLNGLSVLEQFYL